MTKTSFGKAKHVSRPSAERTSATHDSSIPPAIKGGAPEIRFWPEVPPRWNGEEAEFLSEMVRQKSLFYWNGPQTLRLRERFIEAYPFRYVMPCSSGTAAIHIALMTAGIGWGDEVITSPITDMGSVIGILSQQAVPVFADIDPETFNLCPKSVSEKISSRTRAILVVHQAGNPCDLSVFQKISSDRGLILLEDCAQAWGALWQGQPVGTVGDFGCYSLNEFKHIGCGDGGMVGTNQDSCGPILQKMGDKGYDRTGGPRLPSLFGMNYRMSEPQAAVAGAQMGRMLKITQKYHQLGTRLTSLLQGIPGIHPPYVKSGNYSTYLCYMMLLDLDQFSCSRDEFVEALRAEGVECAARYLETPIYKYPVFQNHCFTPKGWPVRDMGVTKMDYREVSCPNAEAILARCFTIRLHPGFDDALLQAIERAIRKVASFYSRKKIPSAS